MIYIYGLFDPGNLSLRYIGKTDNIGFRLDGHIRRARHRNGNNRYKDNWIRQLLSEGLEPAIEVLEECTEDNWQEVESAWIKEAREKGARLTNIYEGGRGASSGENAPWYGITGEAHPAYGIKRSGEDNGMWGKEHSEKTKKLIGDKNRQNYSDETKTPWYGKHLSDEHKRNLSIARTGQKKSKEFVENLKIVMSGTGNPMYGKKHSRDAMEKIRVCHNLYNANRKGNISLILELQEEYFRLYGKHHDKYPHR